jgi:hypothetical protein
MGPYAFHGNQWVSYDDAATIRIKVRADRKITIMYYTTVIYLVINITHCVNLYFIVNVVIS